MAVSATPTTSRNKMQQHSTKVKRKHCTELRSDFTVCPTTRGRPPTTTPDLLPERISMLRRYSPLPQYLPAGEFHQTLIHSHCTVLRHHGRNLMISKPFVLSLVLLKIHQTLTVTREPTSKAIAQPIKSDKAPRRRMAYEVYW